MLLAAGVQPNTDKVFEIVAIIVDPHESSYGLKQTALLLTNYQAIQKAAFGNKEFLDTNSGFFSTKISTLNNLTSYKDRITGGFTFKLQQLTDMRLRDYIGFNQLNEPNRALADLLFSGYTVNERRDPTELLNIKMDLGFIGIPGFPLFLRT